MPDRAADSLPAVNPVVDDPWRDLRRFTAARIGLGRAGVSQPTEHHLAFQLAHAQARDAVHSALDTDALQRELGRRGIESIVVQSAAPDRQSYLLRPDLGRRLADTSRALLRERLGESRVEHDVALVIADGLSAAAIQRHAIPLIDTFLPELVARRLRVAPLAIVTQGRVAVADEIGCMLNARQSVILIGERPGLSAHDSVGMYITFGPRVGRTDAERNCISNVRAAGLSYERASAALLHLVTESLRTRTSGVALKGYDGASDALSDTGFNADPSLNRS